MTGHHEVRLFELQSMTEGVTLPSGWKPFAVIKDPTRAFIVARKWVRDEKAAQEEPGA